MQQAIIWFIPIFFSIAVTLFYIFWGINGNKKIKGLFIQVSIVNFIILLSGGFLWFSIASDGFSQINGITIYTVIFVAIEIIASIALYFVSKHKRALESK